MWFHKQCVMGNKPTYVVTRGGEAGSTLEGELRPRTSEESYLPMPLTMRRALVEGRRFRHVKPSGEYAVKPEESGVRGSGGERVEQPLCEPSTGLMTSATDLSPSSEKESKATSCRASVVTVLNARGIQNKSTNDINPFISKVKSACSKDITNETLKHLHKSPKLTNRRYSLIDMRTGLKKSKFTLELEEKLRQSKFNLGFDDGLDEWKEFSYRMENPESGKESLKKGALKFGLEGNVGKGLETVCLRDPLQYCAHNCQILGLCSVRSPDVLPKQESSILQEEISRKHHEVKSLLKGELEHHKKEDCNCDHCMLAYLTEIGLPEDDSKNQSVPVRKLKSPKESPRSHRKRIKQRIRIVENENTRKSIEISVSSRPSTVNSLRQTLGENSSQSNFSTGTLFEEDTTNRRIKSMFQKNNAATKGLDGGDRNGNGDDISLGNLASTEDVFQKSECFNNRLEEVLQYQTEETRRPPAMRRQTRSSSSTLGVSVSSSLSSVLSYRRVRQIFQSIIERNRARRRPRKNINKFRELEELGLGEVKNNHWYPSDSKTFSIWRGMHQSVQGVQAEFKKYPKVYLKRLD